MMGWETRTFLGISSDNVIWQFSSRPWPWQFEFERRETTITCLFKPQAISISRGAPLLDVPKMHHE
jgi:hypothetical protein